MDDDLFIEAKELVDAAMVQGVTFGFAESCTSGLIAASVGSVPGASNVFAGSVVSYMLSVKERILGVEGAILHDPAIGAVSAECASRMAQGARKVLGVDMAVSVTGIAGPGGAEPNKPVGTVWFGYSDARNTYTELRLFDGNRNEIRNQAACFAMRLVREGLMKDRSPN